MVRLPGPLDLTGLNDIADLDRAELKFPAFVPTTHTQLAEVESASPVDVFGALRRNDVLLHHPYDSFATSVQRFIEQAAADPHVLAIKQTLYRTSGDSPIIDALVDAAEAGKQVLVLDRDQGPLRRAGQHPVGAASSSTPGCHVVYGLVGLKTHCKLAMVVRDEPDGIRRYVHIGTGNYNPKTARYYEDYGLLTAHDGIGEDVAHLFNNLSGFSRHAAYENLLVAPDSVRDGLLRWIAQRGGAPPGRPPARIRIKANSVVDEADHRRAVPRLAGRRARRPADPGHLRAAARGGRPVGDDPGALGARALPGAQPDLLVRERRRPRGLDRLRGPHAPQPRPPRGGLVQLPGEPRWRRSAGCSTWRSTTGRRRGGSRRRDVDAARARRGRLGAARHAGAADHDQASPPSLRRPAPAPYGR